MAIWSVGNMSAEAAHVASIMSALETAGPEIL